MEDVQQQLVLFDHRNTGEDRGSQIVSSGNTPTTEEILLLIQNPESPRVGEKRKSRADETDICNIERVKRASQKSNFDQRRERANNIPAAKQGFGTKQQRSSSHESKENAPPTSFVDIHSSLPDDEVYQKLFEDSPEVTDDDSSSNEDSLTPNVTTRSKAKKAT